MVSEKVIFGVTNNLKIKAFKDLNFSESAILITLAFTIILFGFYPEPLIKTMSASVDQLIINYQSDLTYHLTASQK